MKVLDCVALRFFSLAVWHVQTSVLQGPPAQARIRFPLPEEGELWEQWPDDARTLAHTQGGRLAAVLQHSSSIVRLPLTQWQLGYARPLLSTHFLCFCLSAERAPPTSPGARAAARCDRCMVCPNAWPLPVLLRKQAEGLLLPEEGELSEQWPDDARSHPHKQATR